jgi:hypothetical protein
VSYIVDHITYVKQFDHQGKHYHTTLASDLKRDGMGLELASGSHTVAEIFYSDVSKDFTISIFEQSLPLAVIERLLAEAKVALPPVIRS